MVFTTLTNGLHMFIAIDRIAFRFLLRSRYHRRVAEVAEWILILHFVALREPPFDCAQDKQDRQDR